jgi:hypothetical protein
MVRVGSTESEGRYPRIGDKRASPMTFEQHWLDNETMARISRQVPSTAFGRDCMRDVWPKKFQGLCPSETYRGYAIGLAMVRGQIRPGSSLRDLNSIIDRVDQAIKTSGTIQTNADLRGGAVLQITNAWSAVNETGLSADMVIAAFESELIYAARMFVAASQQGL